MNRTFLLCRNLTLASLLVLAGAAAGCALDTSDSASANITDVNHTDVERQSIGNCWLYAQASWVESLHLTATGEAFDVSQSYWTYWHWFEQVVDNGSLDEISTGGGQYRSNALVLDRGLIAEDKFIAEDAQSEMSYAQKSALGTMNSELKSGRLKDADSRRDAKLVRQVMDEAWGLTDEVRGYLTKAFGEDGAKTLRDGASTAGTPIVSPHDFAVRYTERVTDPNKGTVKDTNLAVAIEEWEDASYPSWGSGSELEKKRRSFQIRVQKALHDAQPVVITWDVDFNAMESGEGELQGSFNMTTLKNAGGPGRQGGHMTVLEDYEATTDEYGLLKAGETLDPNKPEDKAKLDALLKTSTKIKFLRIKNSWGGFRDDRASAPGFPGYHDLYLDYLNGPITWCPDVEGAKTAANCKDETNPWNSVMLPPGY